MYNRTKVVVGVACAFPLPPHVARRTVLERVMSVSDVLKKMYLIPVCKERNSYAMDWCVSPPLICEYIIIQVAIDRSGQKTDLVIESPCWLQEVEEFLICFASPEIHVRNFKVAPIYGVMWIIPNDSDTYNRLQWHRLYVSPSLLERKSIAFCGWIYCELLAMNSVDKKPWPSVKEFLWNIFAEIPLTLCQSVGIVCGHSTRDIVNPEMGYGWAKASHQIHVSRVPYTLSFSSINLNGS